MKARAAATVLLVSLLLGLKSSLGLAQVCPPPVIDPTAVVSPDATLGCGVVIGARSRIRSGAAVGDNTQLGASIRFGTGASIGADGVVGDRTTLQTDAVVGDNAQIGSRVRIGRDVVIGDNAVIEDRAVIRSGANLAQSVTVGERSTIAAGTVISAGTAVPVEESVPSRDGGASVPSEDEDPDCDTVRDCYDRGSPPALQCAEEEDVPVEIGLVCVENRSDPRLDTCLQDADCPVGFCDFGACNDPSCDSDSDCDDGRECTVDLCLGDGTCVALPTIPGTSCGVGRVCDSDGGCVDPCASDLDCDDGEECTSDFCSLFFHVCSSVAKPDGEPCSIGQCSSGQCLAPPPCERDRDCDDDNECTADSCDLNTGQCLNASEPTTKVCGSGGCVDGVSSPLGNCDGAGACDNGAENCSALWQPCKDYFCDVATGLCASTNRFNGLLCGSQQCQGNLLVGKGCQDGECVEGGAQSDCMNIHRPDEPGRCCGTRFGFVGCFPCDSL